MINLAFVLRALVLSLLPATVGCATPYAYTFHLENQGARAAEKPHGGEAIEDADVRAEILLDPTSARAILFDLTNKSDQVLQVEWAHITMRRSDGTATSLRPQEDLGWILPGATTSTRLVPFVLPRTGGEAASYQGNHFELVVPMIVHRESREYRYSFAVTVREI